MANAFRVFRFIVIAGILATLTWLVMDHNSEQKRILVVHSYQKDLAWVNELDDGLRQALMSDEQDKKTSRNLDLRTHYMDLRNHNNCNYYKIAATDVRFTIDDWQPEVVIIFDDLAQGLVGFNQIDWAEPDKRDAIAERLLSYLVKSGCPDQDRTLEDFELNNPATDYYPTIVFGGVNGGVENYGYEYAKNVTGIFERKNYDAIIEKLIALRDAYGGPVSGVQMLNDGSLTATSETKRFLQEDWGPFETADPVQVTKFADWQATVEAANENNLMLMIANYGGITDDKGARVRQTQLIAWTERNAKLPVLGLNTRFIDDGGMIAIAISGTEQGRRSIDMALDAIDGKALKAPLDAEQYTIGLNQSLVRKRNLYLPSVYEAFSREVQRFIPVMEDVYESQTGDREQKN